MKNNTKPPLFLVSRIKQRVYTWYGNTKKKQNSSQSPLLAIDSSLTIDNSSVKANSNEIGIDIPDKRSKRNKRSKRKILIYSLLLGSSTVFVWPVSAFYKVLFIGSNGIAYVTFRYKTNRKFREKANQSLMTTMLALQLATGSKINIAAAIPVIMPTAITRQMENVIPEENLQTTRHVSQRESRHHAYAMVPNAPKPQRHTKKAIFFLLDGSWKIVDGAVTIFDRGLACIELFFGGYLLYHPRLKPAYQLSTAQINFSSLLLGGVSIIQDMTLLYDKVTASTYLKQALIERADEAYNRALDEVISAYASHNPVQIAVAKKNAKDAGARLEELLLMNMKELNLEKPGENLTKVLTNLDNAGEKFLNELMKLENPGLQTAFFLPRENNPGLRNAVSDRENVPDFADTGLVDVIDITLENNKVEFNNKKAQSLDNKEAIQEKAFEPEE